MNYVSPLTSNLSTTYNDITYTVDYYRSAITITGVTDEPYSEWADGTTYDTGDYVKIDDLKKIYRSAADSNTGIYPLSDTTKWIDYGSLNSYNMFASDENIGAQTTGTDVLLEFDFNSSDSMAWIDIDFISAEVTLFDASVYPYQSDYDAGTSYSENQAVYYDGSIYISLADSNLGNTPDTNPTEWAINTDDVYLNEEIQGTDFGCFTFAEYFYDDVTVKNRVITNGLEWLPSGVMRIKFNGAVSIGTIVYGSEKTLGCSLVGSSLKYEDRSKITENSYTGFRTVVRYGKIRVLDCSVIFDTDEFNLQSQKIEEIISKNILWIPTDNDKFSESISIGYIEDFTIPMEDAEKTQTTTTIIGVSK